MERGFFIGLPKDKRQGFCQPADAGVYKDGGTVVNIIPDCIICKVGECMMFRLLENRFGGRRRLFKKHPPAYKK